MIVATATPHSLGPWDLSELLPEPSDTVLQQRLAAIEAEVAGLEALRPALVPGVPPATLLDALRRYEALSEAISVLGSYASLWFSADMQSPAALAFKSRVQQALTGFANRLLFLGLWWKGLEEAEAGRLLAALDEQPDLVHHLHDLRRLRPHTLEEKSEQVINLKDADGMGGLLTVYSMLTTRLEFTLRTERGAETLTRDALMAHAYSPRPELREGAYRELYRVYGHEAPILGEIYAHRVRDWHNEQVGLRGFASPIAVRNIDNDVPDAAVEALLDVVREQAPLFHRYFRWKAGKLGQERLRRYDLYAPVAGSQREVPYGEAVALVLDTFRRSEPRFAEQAERVFAARHVDSELRRGKRGGAFCATVLPRLAPWLLLNYAGRVRDVATLAHELGHAVHSMMAEHHSVLTQHASLPLAETASVVAEILLVDRLLAEERDPATRRELLAAAIDDVYATVMRQAFFTWFEIDAHRAVLAGKGTEELADLYLQNLRQQFGDSVEVPEEFRLEWVTIPHIYLTPFYCYAYSFGQLLVLALYRRFLDEGEAFKPGYLRLLAHGGSARPLAILAEVGVDPTDPGFWRGGFEVLAHRIAELESLG